MWLLEKQFTKSLFSVETCPVCLGRLRLFFGDHSCTVILFILLPDSTYLLYSDRQMLTHAKPYLFAKNFLLHFHIYFQHGIFCFLSLIITVQVKSCSTPFQQFNFSRKHRNFRIVNVQYNLFSCVCSSILGKMSSRMTSLILTLKNFFFNVMFQLLNLFFDLVKKNMGFVKRACCLLLLITRFFQTW